MPNTQNKIEILIDEKACRGCQLCVDICPTRVFEFDEKEQRARVKTAEDCIGCMSCQYICPANCITQNGLYYSKNFYRDAAVYEQSGKYLFPVPDKMELSPDDYRRAAADLSVRLTVIGTTFKKMVGASAPTVATTAGRAAAWHLPEMYEEKGRTLSSLLEDLKGRFHCGWAMEVSMKGDNEAGITISTCPIRDVCTKAGLALGGDLCDLFRSYLTGLLVEILKKRPMIKIESTGPSQCQYSVKLIET